MPNGTMLERFLEEGRAAGRIACPPALVPAAGQYLLAYDPASDDALAVPLFPAGSTPDGFLVAPPLPPSWNPGRSLSLRGPFGHGFRLPVSTRRVALLALDGNPALLLPLLNPSLAQDASVAIACDISPADLPDAVEIHPLKSWNEVWKWADYVAVSVQRENWPPWRAKLATAGQAAGPREAQALIVTSMPCGGLADCGVCALSVALESKLICKDGPVFDMFPLLRS
jgi:hypothetical protein